MEGNERKEIQLRNNEGRKEGRFRYCSRKTEGGRVELK